MILSLRTYYFPKLIVGENKKFLTETSEVQGSVCNIWF